MKLIFVKLKGLSRFQNLATNWTVVGKDIWEMFPLDMIADWNPRDVFKVKTYSTSKSLFLIFDDVFIKIFRSGNILKDKS